MARETKVGLLISVGVILLIGIIISDHLSVVRKAGPSAALTDFGNSVQHSIYPAGDNSAKGETIGSTTDVAPVRGAIRKYPTPEELRERARLESVRKYNPAAPAHTPGVNADTGPVRAFALGRNVPRNDNPASAGRELSSTNPGRRSLAGRQTPAVERILGPTSAAASGGFATPSTITPGAASRVTSKAATNPPVHSGEIVHTVKKGESLYQIARKYYNNGEYWRTIARANPKKVSADGQVRVGVQLLIPNRAGLVRQAGDASARPPSNTNERTITVHPGDTLAGLAKRYLGDGSRWHQLLKANGDQLNRPQDLQAGMTLKLPAAAKPGPPASTARHAGPTTRIYTVRKGDTLSLIARRMLGSREQWRKIYQANRGKLQAPDRMRVGQTLRIPNS